MFGRNNSKSIQSNGNGNLNNTGYIGQVHLHTVPKTLNRSYLFDICEKISRLPEAEEEYKLSIPSGIIEKMEYHELVIYRAKFESTDHLLGDVEGILKEFLKPSSIINTVHFIYLEHREAAQWTNKDSLCKLVFEDLKIRLSKDRNAEDFWVEEAEHALYALMYYCFTKCKLLDPIP